MELDRVKQIRALLPASDLALGYGSGVIRQSGYGNDSGEMIDVLVLTRDRQAYVRSLLERRYISANACLFASSINPQILFFPNVEPLPGIRLKIGVVDALQCLERLKDWGDSFYIPGRLQKPVRIIDSPDTEFLGEFIQAQLCNHQSALLAALLNLPQHVGSEFTLNQLYSSLVGLSYLGDVRVGIAENPNKIPNIVSAQFHLLEDIYRPHFGATGIFMSSDGWYTASKTPDDLWKSLPPNFTRSAIQLADSRDALRATLSSINRRESLKQALVGVGTAGIGNSFRYLARKVSKRFK